jgi:antitoxin FitA
VARSLGEWLHAPEVRQADLVIAISDDRSRRLPQPGLQVNLSDRTGDAGLYATRTGRAMVTSDALKSVTRQPRDASALEAGRRLAAAADLCGPRMWMTFRGPLRGLAEVLHPADARPGDFLEARHAVQLALWRYNSAMATIQVREVPEELYEVLRRRARRAGQSMQSYMREQLLALAGRPTKEEAIEEIEAVLERAHTSEPAAASVVADLAAERR